MEVKIKSQNKITLAFDNNFDNQNKVLNFIQFKLIIYGKAL